MEKIKKNNRCVVTRVAIGFRDGYHHVKLDAENKTTLQKRIILMIDFNNHFNDS